jgi:hypothetical protein
MCDLCKLFLFLCNHSVGNCSQLYAQLKIHSTHKKTKMRISQLLSVVALTTITLFSACKKDTDEPTPNGTTNPTVIPIQTTKQTKVVLGASSSFAVICGAEVTNTGATVITGDLGLSPGTSIGGFPPGTLNGALHINDSLANQAKRDITTAYNDAAGRVAAEIVTLSGNIGGLTLTPGLYKSTSSLAISSGDVTFDAKGDANAVFVIQIASSLTTTSGRKVILAGGALPSNIFWQVGSSATFGTTSVFKGVVIVMETISFNTGATLDGSAMARTGSITMDANTIVR